MPIPNFPESVSGATAFPVVHARILGNTSAIGAFRYGVADVTWIGTGHYQINLLSRFEEDDMIISIMPESGAARIFGATPVDDGAIEVKSWDAAGAAANMNFRFYLWNSRLVASEASVSRISP